MSICLCRCALSVGEQGDEYLKGKTSHKLLMEFAHLRRQFWGRHLWARGYFAASSGNVTDEVILQYIATQGQEPSEADEDFKIEE